MDPQRRKSLDSAAARANGHILPEDRDVTVEPIITRLSDVEPRAMRFLWQPYLRSGAVNILDGDPGLGKSLLTLSLAACITRGWPLPDEGDGVPRQVRDPADVLFMVCEDNLADCVRPRFDAAGGDPDRFHVLQGVRVTIEGKEPKEKDFLLDQHLELLEKAIAGIHPGFVAIDPLFGFVGGKTDVYRDNEVREILRPLKAISERYDTCTLALRHLNKSTGTSKAIYRGGGSIGFTATARSVLVVGEDPNRPGHYILAHSKTNAARGASLGYAIATKTTADGIEAGAIEWTGPVEVNADDLLRQPERIGPAVQEAVEWLAGRVASGPVNASNMEDEASERGISETTLKRAKAALGVESIPRYEKGKIVGWEWRLP